MLDTKAKRKALEAAGWKFERRNSQRRWVKVGNSRQVTRAIEWAYKQMIGSVESPRSD